MVAMGTRRSVEEWSEDDLDRLLELPFDCIAESAICHRAGAHQNALLALSQALEAVLLGMVITHEENLREDNQWPAKVPSKMHLAELAGLAKKRGWLTDPAAHQVVEVLNKARTMAAHPGAYVRAMRQAPDFELRVPEGYDVCFDIVTAACQQLSVANQREMRHLQGTREPKQA